MRWFLGLVFALVAQGGLLAATTEVQLFLSEAVAKPGSTITAALRLKMAPQWHTYWKNSGDSGKPTKIQWTLPEGITAGEMEWPVPEKGKLDDLYTYNLHDEAALIIPIQIAGNVSAGAKALKGKVTWVECEKECIMATGMVEATLTVGAEAQPSPDAARIAEWKNKIPKAGSDIEVAANWEGAGTADKRSLMFTVSKPDGEWDFFNYQLDNADIKANTERVEPLNGKVRFRKVIEKFDGDWPKELKGLLLIAADEKSARETTVRIEGAAAGAVAPATATAGQTEAVSSGGQHTLLGILGLAFLGGLILNVMPCVLPVISLKILGFVRQANDDPKRIRQLGLIYAAGVIVSFMALAAFVIGVKQSTGSATWGMQLQNPKFLLFLTALVTLISLNLFGVFEITLGGRAMDAAGQLASREGGSGAFFNGALATILATPCTGPFMAPALGFAFTQTTAVILLTFLALAAGMAFPYVALCWYPGWLKKLPRPGPWMEKFKNAMGFPMLATAIWLFSVTLRHFDRAAFMLGLGMLTIACAAWVYGEFVQRGVKARGFAGAVAAALVAFAIFYFPARLSKPAHSIGWQNWSPAAVQAARAQGRPVLVDFTADWCAICQANKKSSIEIASVRQKITDLNVAAFIADTTIETPPAVAEELQRYQRTGVPLVLVFPPDANSPPMVLPALLTPGIVLEALDKASTRALKMTGK